MNRYEPSTPRTALGVVGCALAVATFALLVAGPASFVGEGDSGSVMATRQVTPGDVRVLPPVYVVAKREGNVQPVHARVVQFLRRLYS